jgi:hypothetical protein
MRHVSFVFLTNVSTPSPVEKTGVLIILDPGIRHWLRCIGVLGVVWGLYHPPSCEDWRALTPKAKGTPAEFEVHDTIKV